MLSGYGGGGDLSGKKSVLAGNYWPQSRPEKGYKGKGKPHDVDCLGVWPSVSLEA